jgi:flavin-dependent dehydrogenase
MANIPAGEYGIVIIGGGPGGLSTALHLARDYPHLVDKTLVLEKAAYPRPKLCAGGLVVDAEKILKRLGLDSTDVPHVDADEVHLDFEGRGLGMRLRKRHALRIIRRDEFDSWLARKAQERGIRILQQVTVRDVRVDAQGVSVETDQGAFRAQIAVGADGSNGVTRRCVLPAAPVSTARVLELITPQPSRAAHGKTAAYFDFFPVPQGIAGYTWDFPTQVKGQPARCWGVYDTNLLAYLKRPPLKETLREEMKRHGLDIGDYELQGHPIRWFDPFQALSTPRVLFVGDAAGADPFFGEGISIALGYGALAAREIGRAFAREDFTFQGYKGRMLRSGLGRSLLSRWFFANLIYSLRWRWFQMLVWRFMKLLVLGMGWLVVLNWSGGRDQRIRDRRSVRG